MTDLYLMLIIYIIILIYFSFLLYSPHYPFPLLLMISNCLALAVNSRWFCDGCAAVPTWCFWNLLHYLLWFVTAHQGWFHPSSRRLQWNLWSCWYHYWWLLFRDGCWYVDTDPLCLVGVSVQVPCTWQYFWTLTWDELWQRYMMIGLSEPMLIAQGNCFLFSHCMHQYQHHLQYSMRELNLHLQVQ